MDWIAGCLINVLCTLLQQRFLVEYEYDRYNRANLSFFSAIIISAPLFFGAVVNSLYEKKCNTIIRRGVIFLLHFIASALRSKLPNSYGLRLSITAHKTVLPNLLFGSV